MSKDPNELPLSNDEQPIDPEVVPHMTFTVEQEYVHQDTGHRYGEKTDDQRRSFVYIQNPDGSELISTPYNKRGELELDPFFLLGSNIFELASLTEDEILTAHGDFLSSDSLQAGLLWDAPLTPGMDPALAGAVAQASKLLYQLQVVGGLNRGFNVQGDWEPNGCTGVPDVNPAVKACCDAHDNCYAAGGDAEDRLACDRAFRDCIRAAGHPLIADIYYMGVRLFGRFFFNYHSVTTETVPVLPIPDPERPCQWEVKLMTVQYNGNNIGNDWKYKIQVQDGNPVNVGQHTVNHGGVDSQNKVVGSGRSTCGEPTSLQIVIEATEVDITFDDVGNTSDTLKFVCDGGTYNKSVKVYVSETGNGEAILTFNFQITTTCQ